MNPGEIVPLSFNPVLVFLSFVVSVLGSYVALACASKIRRTRGTINRERLWAAAVALGGVAIWSMHFIGMTAHRMPFPVAYDFGSPSPASPPQSWFRHWRSGTSAIANS